MGTTAVHWEGSRQIVLAPSKRHLRPAKLAIAAGLVMLVVSTIGMLRGVEPFATWYYQFSWYSALLAADGVLALLGTAGQKGEFFLLGNKRHLLSMLFWSTVAWFFYELLNFRLQNWYYILLPDNLSVRWISTAVAFATVFPAVFLSEALLSAGGFAEHVRWRPLQVTPRFITLMRWTGAIVMLLVMIWPRYFFALVWGATMLMIEPVVYSRTPQNSLLRDLEQGQPGRLLRLLTGGALIGLMWELLNIKARAKWIYTVPFFEELKLFEMPVPGFLGFPPFAVECFILWQLMVAYGIAVPRFSPALHASSAKRWAAGLGATAFCVAVLVGMDLLTFTSMRPKLSEIPGAPAAQLQQAGYDVFRLAHSTSDVVAADIATDRVKTERWVQAARLATVKGIGTENLILLNQIGVFTVHDLANLDSPKLIRRIESASKQDWVDARLRVWIRGARRAVDKAK